MTFEEFRVENQSYLGSVRKILTVPLPEPEEELMRQLRSIEAHHAKIGMILAEANAQLDVAVATYYEHASSDKTLGEKKFECDGVVSPVRSFRDKIEALRASVETRITLGQSILRAMKR
jgi:hypothetical protein